MADSPALDRIFFLYGPDSAARGAKARVITDAFTAKHGAHNLDTFDGGELKEIRALRSAAAAMPFLGERRLIVLRDPFRLPAEAQRGLAEFLPKLPETAVLLVVESGEPDRRTTLWKALSKLPRAEELGNPTPAELAARIRSKVPGLSAELAKLVAERVAGDTELAARETEKLAVLAPEQLTRDMVEQLVCSYGDDAPWQLLDAFAARRGGEVRRGLAKLFTQGEPPQKLLALLAGTTRSLLVLSDLRTRGVAETHWAAEAGMPPWQLGKLRSALAAWADADLRALHAELVRLDERWKSSDATEPETDLAVLAATFCAG